MSVSSMNQFNNSSQWVYLQLAQTIHTGRFSS